MIVLVGYGLLLQKVRNGRMGSPLAMALGQLTIVGPAWLWKSAPHHIHPFRQKNCKKQFFTTSSGLYREAWRS